ncbi:MAG: hypothetical protein P8J37_14120 [Fuerstiella sp.]|nr:hypothetical protein [Fuerstiella sp.]
MTSNAILKPFFFAAACVVVVGCQSEPETLPDVTVTVPDQFDSGGQTWQKQANLQQADNDCLTRFFARNQGIVDSPEFEGQPTVFLSGKNDRRFYWLRAAADGIVWRCVEFKNRKFSPTDGTGNPFQ